MPVVSINVCLVKGRREGASSLRANLSNVFRVEEWQFIRQTFSNILTINMQTPFFISRTSYRKSYCTDYRIKYILSL